MILVPFSVVVAALVLAFCLWGPGAFVAFVLVCVLFKCL